MSSVITTKTWTVLANQRRAYTTLVDQIGYFAFTNLTQLLAAGWTVKFTSTGIVGPTNSSDTTNRIAAVANFATRATIAAAAQSWFVVQNGDSMQLLFTYQGATDDIMRISYSEIGFTLAGTTTQQPTAADEMVITLGNTVVNATTSLDRVMTIWTTSDAKAWSCALFRAGALVSILGMEKITSLCATGVYALSYVGYRYLTGAITTSATAGANGPVGGIPNVAIGAATYSGAMARVITAGSGRNIRVGGGEINVAPAVGTILTIATTFNSNTPALSGGAASPLIPIYWSGEKAANTDGLLGYPIDWWQMKTSSLTTPALGDFVPAYEIGDTIGVTPVRSNWLVCLGAAMVRPWKAAAVSLEIT